MTGISKVLKDFKIKLSDDMIKELLPVEGAAAAAAGEAKPAAGAKPEEAKKEAPKKEEKKR